MSLDPNATVLVTPQDNTIFEVYDEKQLKRISYSALAAALSSYVNDETSNYVNVKSYGALGDAVTNDVVAIQNAANYCYANNKTLFFPDGNYNLEDKLTLRCNTTASYAAAIRTNYNGDGIQIGSDTEYTNFIEVYLPRVNKIVNRWWSGTPAIGTDIGLRVINTRYSRIAFDRIENYSIGLSVEGNNSKGSSDIYFEGIALYDNAINLRLKVQNSGWSTQNRYRISKYHLSNTIGTLVSGTRLYQNLTTVDGGTNWIDGGNFEGDAAEYKIETYGDSDLIQYCRFETTALLTTPAILLQNTASKNHFDRCMNITNVNFVSGSGYVPTKNLITYIDTDGTLVNTKV